LRILPIAPTTAFWRSPPVRALMSRRLARFDGRQVLVQDIHKASLSHILIFCKKLPGRNWANGPSPADSTELHHASARRPLV
jgi:hypothetical protein